MLLIAGGTVIDGTGAKRYAADVLISGDRIEAIEPPGTFDRHEAIERRIDAAGLIVAPGFIDVHNHSDGWLLKTPHLIPKTTQGITTEVLASDGLSYAPVSPETVRHWIVYLRSLNGLELADYSGWETIADYLALLDGRTAQNVVMQIPFANLRTMAKGWDRAPADDTEIRNMRQWVVDGMEQGAVGLSTGLDYVCQCFATTAEIAEVAEAMRPWGGLYVTHMRYKKGLLASLKEAVEISRRAGVPLHVSHFKTDSPRVAEEVLDYVDRVAVNEVDFSFDGYPYLPGSTMLHFMLPYEVWEQGPLGVMARLNDPAVRRRFAELLRNPIRVPLDSVYVAWVPGKDKQQWIGRSLGEYITHSGKPAAEALIDLLIDEHLAALTVFRGGNDDLVEPFLKHPRYLFGSDGIDQPDGCVHPRQFGSATRILGPLVRDRCWFTLEEAVRKLSGYPAERFGLRDRGVVRRGAYADLALFDPDRITDRATFEQPRQTSVGIEHLIVNGTPILEHGRPHPGTPGRVLRFNAN